MKGKGRRLLSVIMTAIITIAVLPVMGNPMVAKAAPGDKTIASLSTDAISNPTVPITPTTATSKDVAWNGNYVWFGTYEGNPVKYRVLSNATTEYSGTTGAKTIFLDCDSILFETRFDDDGNPNTGATKANEWQYSDLRNKLNGDMFLNGQNTTDGADYFTDSEKNVIANSTKSGYDLTVDTSYATGPNGYYVNKYTGLDGEKIFVLDMSDTLNPQYGYSDYCGKVEANSNLSGGNGWESVNNRRKYEDNPGTYQGYWVWWLRSPHCLPTIYAGVVNSVGSTSIYTVDYEGGGVSPAFNINLSSIIFSSLIPGTGGSNDEEYKLTVADGNINVALATSKIATISSSNIVSIPYSITGDNKNNTTQVSVLILDDEWTAGNANNANILYYRKLSTTGTFSTTGTGTFDFSDTNLDLADWGKNYRVYILAEDVNTGNLTDYASVPYELATPPAYDSYTVSFDANGGSGSMSNQNRTYNDNTALTANVFTLEGYTFTGWNTKADGSGIAFADKTTDNITSTVGTVTLYAQWGANSYTVKFDANGGTGTMSDMSRKFDDNTALTANAFILEGSTFSGWNTSADGSGTSYADGATDNLTSTDGVTVTLYAMWDSVSYTVTVTNDGNGTATASATSGIKGTNITLTATPNEGYKFSGWDVVSGGVTLADASSASTTFAIGTSNVEVKATFEEVPVTEYSVTVSNDGNGTASASVTSGIEGTEVTITATANEGYKFAGWQVVSGGVTLADENAETTTFKIGTADVEIKASFELITTTPEPEPDPEIPEKDWLDDLRTALHVAAELGGEQSVEYTGDFALPYEFMSFLAEHPTITLIYHVTYEDVEYTITIPAGKALASPDIEWYGPLWLLANYGGNNVPDIISGSGKYIVKPNDTLWSISIKLGVSVQYLVDKNGIKNPDYIIIGQVINY